MTKKITIRMNRIYPYNEIELSQIRFKHYHEHHLIIKQLRIDYHPQEDERTILILSEGLGKVLRSIELIPYSYILIVDPNFYNYKCIEIEEKKVIKVGLPHIVLIQILQTIRIKIDALFLSIADCEKVDFLTQMVFPIMKDEFLFISNRTNDNEYLLNYYEGKFTNLPFEFAYKMKQDEYHHLYFFGLAIKKTQKTQYIKLGKYINLVHGCFWDMVDSNIQVVFLQFPDDWSEYIISLYENDIISIEGKYKSADNKVFNLKRIESLDAMVAKCGFESVAFTLHPQVWEKVERIIRSDNNVREIFVFGFYNDPNYQIPTFSK